ncbi:MAG: hypothetical protein ABT01_05705 [Clostridium sp. SCN 57-10]|nr:MAG: hypothetical protein ABT01_05705 [Clostridium sp. SCN 57-10]
MHCLKLMVTGVAVAVCMTASVFAFDVKGGTVEAGSAVNVRENAGTGHAVVEKLNPGDRVCVLDATDGWYKIAFGGEVGYMSSEYVALQSVMNVEPGGAKVTTDVLNLRAGPSTSQGVVTRLTRGTVTKIIGINNGWFKVTVNGKTGYLHPDYVEIVDSVADSTNASSASASAPAAATTSTGSTVRQDVLTYAKTFLGVRYVYGGSTPKGFDCSGYTKYVFSHFNISLQRSSASQYSTSVTKVKKSELKPGDLVFFGTPSKPSKVGHVGIYMGGNQFIHSSSPGDVVKIDTMSSGYYANYYIGGGTVLN